MESSKMLDLYAELTESKKSRRAKKRGEEETSTDLSEVIVVIMNKPVKLSYVDQRLCFALYSTSQAIIKKYQPYLAQLGMTYPQYLVFITLESVEKVTVKSLGETLFLDSGTLSPLLKRMEQSGLITRCRDTEDERQVLVSLTKKARSLRRKVAEMQYAVSCSTGLNRKEFREMLQKLQELNHRLRV